MKRKLHVMLVAAAVVIAQLACNLPNPAGSGSTPDLPGPNKTLTALFAITPADVTATATLPPVVTATKAGGDNNSGGGQAPTATRAPANQPTATLQPANLTATNTNVPAQPTNTNPPPQPTQTFTKAPPAATATVPSVRNAVKAVANYMSTPPTIDGDWGEWKDVTVEYPLNNVVFGAGNWTGEEDLSASYHVGWDNTYLYIAVKVYDDKYVQGATGADIYKGDSIEILMDGKLKDDYYYNKLSPDDFQLGMSPGNPDVNGTKEAYLWFPTSVTGKRSDVKMASTTFGGGYRFEAAIPWSLFEVTPANGLHLGFAISVSDNDDPSSNKQQTMISNDPNRSLVDPTSWGDLQLVK